MAVVLRSFVDGRLFGVIWGSEPSTVLALHGWRRSHQDFARSLGPSNPAGPLDVLALDLPGFGATPPPSEAWGSAQYAALVAEALDRRAAGPSGRATALVVVGHSLGGRVAVRLAASRPDLVAGLVLCGAPVAPSRRPPPRPARSYRLVRRLHRLGVLPETVMERARQRHGSADYRAADGVMRQVLVTMVGEDYQADLHRLACPVHLVWGDDDTAASLADAEALAALVPGAELTVCPGAGHLVPQTAPGPLRSATEQLLVRTGLARAPSS